MKALLYYETAKGNRLLVSIGEASIDPLETSNNGTKHAHKSPKFGELKARIKNYNDYLAKCKADGIKFADDDTVPPKVRAELRNRLLVVAGLQDELLVIKKDYEKENPIYMLPASSMLVDDQHAADIELADTEGKVIALRTGKGDVYAGYELIENNQGKSYRMPKSMKRLIVQEPDEDIPGNAMFEAPDEYELKAMDNERIAKLSAEDKAKEKADRIKMIKNQFAIDVIAADLEESPEATDAVKAEARTQYDARLKEIEAIYI